MDSLQREAGLCVEWKTLSTANPPKHCFWECGEVLRTPHTTAGKWASQTQACWSQEPKQPFFFDFLFFFPSISIKPLYYFITEIVCAFNEREEHLQMPLCLKAKLLGVTELQGIAPCFRSSPFLC